MYANKLKAANGRFNIGVRETPYVTCPQVKITDLWPDDDVLTREIINKIAERVAPLSVDFP